MSRHVKSLKLGSVIYPPEPRTESLPACLWGARRPLRLRGSGARALRGPGVAAWWRRPSRRQARPAQRSQSKAAPFEFLEKEVNEARDRRERAVAPGRRSKI